MRKPYAWKSGLHKNMDINITEFITIKILQCHPFLIGLKVIPMQLKQLTFTLSKGIQHCAF